MLGPRFQEMICLSVIALALATTTATFILSPTPVIRGDYIKACADLRAKPARLTVQSIWQAFQTITNARHNAVWIESYVKANGEAIRSSYLALTSEEIEGQEAAPQINTLLRQQDVKDLEIHALCYKKLSDNQFLGNVLSSKSNKSFKNVIYDISDESSTSHHSAAKILSRERKSGKKEKTIKGFKNNDDSDDHEAEKVIHDPKKKGGRKSRKQRSKSSSDYSSSGNAKKTIRKSKKHSSSSSTDTDDSSSSSSSSSTSSSSTSDSSSTKHKRKRKHH